jgi:hypothetical protein
MRLFLSLLLFALAGCGKDFDDRYAETAKQVRDKEARIDKARAKEARKEAGER